MAKSERGEASNGSIKNVFGNVIVPIGTDTKSIEDIMTQGPSSELLDIASDISHAVEPMAVDNLAAAGIGYGTGGNPDRGSVGSGFGSGGNPDKGGQGFGAGGNPDRGPDRDGETPGNKPDDAGNPAKAMVRPYVSNAPTIQLIYAFV